MNEENTPYQILTSVMEFPFKFLGVAKLLIALTIFVAFLLPFLYFVSIGVVLAALGLLVDFFCRPTLMKIYIAAAFAIACFIFLVESRGSIELPFRVRRGRRLQTHQAARHASRQVLLRRRIAHIRRRIR
jgi:hypothetical protein